MSLPLKAAPRLVLSLLFQAGKSYEQLKEELGDAAAITRITAVSCICSWTKQVTQAAGAREKL